MVIDSDEFRQVMQKWATGVAVVTASHNGVEHGMTVSSLTSVSAEPSSVSVSLNKSSHAHGLVINSSNFGVTILSDGQKKISDHFAGRTVGPEDRLSYLETESQVCKPSFIKGGLANLVCKVIQTVPTGMKTVFIAEVIVVQVKDKGRPLFYYDRDNWQLQEQPL